MSWQASLIVTPVSQRDMYEFEGEVMLQCRECNTLEGEASTPDNEVW